MALRLNNPSSCRPFIVPFLSLNSTSLKRSCSMRSQMNTKDSHKVLSWLCFDHKVSVFGFILIIKLLVFLGLL